MKVETIPVVLCSGTGVLERIVTGRVRTARLATDDLDSDIQPNEIIVVDRSDRTLIPLARRAAGLITQQGGPGCHAAMLATELGVPAIVGVQDALQKLQEGMEITMDTSAGLIYAGRCAE